MKVAVVFTGNTTVQTGLFNNALERYDRLRKEPGIEVDIFLIQGKPSWLYNKLKPTDYVFEETTNINDITIRNIWIKDSVFEYIMVYKLKLRDVAGKKQVLKYKDQFKGYDLLSVHGVLDGVLASAIKKAFNIPFVITWHGSDINVYPLRSKRAYKTIKNLLDEANYNFFVSKKLLRSASEISTRNNKRHLYTGVSDFFSKWVPKRFEKDELKTDYIVGFIGNLVEIKNVLVLSKIFQVIQSRIKNITFIIVGDGPLMKLVKDNMKRDGVENIIFTGNVSPDKIPGILRSFDVLVLPSLNEGLPLVTLEAQKSGVHVVGSKVGGIPEAIGEKNSIPLDENFIMNFAERVIEIIIGKEPITDYPKDFDWEMAVKIEKKIYKTILKKSQNKLEEEV